jgi:hypothetical protein
MLGSDALLTSVQLRSFNQLGISPSFDNGLRAASRKTLLQMFLFW